MANSTRIISLLESAKNAVIILGIPSLGLYMWNYHSTQVELKNSIIELQQAQLSHAKEYSVEAANQKLVSMKNLYEVLLSSSNDSLREQGLLLDSLSGVLDANDTTARWFGNVTVIPNEMFTRMAANRIRANELLRECRAENKELIEKLKRDSGK